MSGWVKLYKKIAIQKTSKTGLDCYYKFYLHHWQIEWPSLNLNQVCNCPHVFLVCTEQKKEPRSSSYCKTNYKIPLQVNYTLKNWLTEFLQLLAQTRKSKYNKNLYKDLKKTLWSKSFPWQKSVVNLILVEVKSCFGEHLRSTSHN
jgi:hypothetical protein